MDLFTHFYDFEIIEANTHVRYAKEQYLLGACRFRKPIGQISSCSAAHPDNCG